MYRYAGARNFACELTQLRSVPAVRSS